MITSHVEIGALAQDFFADLFSASPYHMETSLFDTILPPVTETDNLDFCKIPDEEEIPMTIRLMNPNGALGNDGYIGYFYVACWEIIKLDLCAFIMDFFSGSLNSEGN